MKIKKGNVFIALLAAVGIGILVWPPNSSPFDSNLSDSNQEEWLEVAFHAPLGSNIWDVVDKKLTAMGYWKRTRTEKIAKAEQLAVNIHE